MKRLILILVITFANFSPAIAQTWNNLPCPQPFAFDISVSEGDVIWTKGQSSPEMGFSLSTDGGASWVTKDFPPLFLSNDFSLGVLSGVNATTAYIIVSTAADQSAVGVYKTIDAGDTWSREPNLFNDIGSFPNQVHFWDADRGFALGDGFEIYEYSFGTWNPATVVANAGFGINTNQFLRIVGNTAYSMTNNGTLLKTTDYGANWTEIPMPFTNQINQIDLSFDFKDENNGIIVFNDAVNNEAYSTSDGGLNWTSMGTDLPNLLHVIKYAPAFQRYYSVGRNANLGLAYSEDDGVTWVNEPSFAGVNLGEMENAIDGTVYLGSSNSVYALEPDYTSHPDYNALVALYTSTNGDSWTTNTNWLDSSQPLETWHGLSLVNNRVTSINLGDNNLTGSLPTEIGDFTELNYLGLWSNLITGTIPSEIGNLSNLVELDLSPNAFSGTIPPEIGNLTNLEILWLNQNGLTGSIPQSFQNLVNLQQLYLVGTAAPPYLNSIYSGVFPDLTALPLFVLDIRRNNFEFSDFENEFDTYTSNIEFFDYSPQYTVDNPESYAQAPGADIVLNITDVDTPDGLMGRVNNLYQWFKDDSAIAGANENSFTIFNAQESDSGIYYCTITNGDFPDFVIQRPSITVLVDPALYTLESEKSILKIFPNPVQDWLTIELNQETKATLKLHDLNGRLIYKQHIEQQQFALNMSNFDSGMYFLTLSSKEQSVTQRVVKH